MMINMENKELSNDASHKDVASIDKLSKLVDNDMTKVNQYIIDNMQSPVALIPQLAGHLIASGGKRLRPMLTIAASQMCQYKGNRHIGLAACVEFIHTATLLHDDVVDQSDLRRGQESANMLWGNQASVLVGDFLFSRAFQLMVADGSIPVLKILSDASAVIAEGEVLQLMTANDPTTSEDAYLEVIESKTAALFAAASRIGAVVADKSQEYETSLHRFGTNLGIAFQLIDDVLDYSAKQADLGKSIGDDFKEGKVTLPIILAWAKADDNERQFWTRTIGKLDQKDGDQCHAMNLMIKHDTLNQTTTKAKYYGQMAQESLDIFPDSDIKETLIELVDFCIRRAH